MPLITAVSFEADDVQIVTVQSTGAGLVIERCITLNRSEFDAFLSVDRSPEYLVAINPPEAIFETIQIPPTAKKLEATLIRSEAGRLHPELSSFACAYQVLGDTPSEGRVIRKVACCLISHQVIMPALEPFIRHNKIVRQMIATPHILSALVADVADSSSEPILCAHDDGQRKTLFLLENGVASFSRSIVSNGYGWDPLDRQNVAMTLDYCFQALRVRSTRVLVLNPLHEEDPNLPPPHLEHLETPLLFKEIAVETLNTALVPLTLAAYKFPEQYDLLPSAYSAERLKQKLFTLNFYLFAGIALCVSLLIIFRLVSISTTEETIKGMRAGETKLVDTVQDFQTAQADKNALQQMLAVWNEVQTAADIPHTLVALNNIQVDSVQLTSLVLKREKEAVAITLAGTVNSTGYAQKQARFEAYLAALQGIQGMQTANKQMDPKGQLFTIEAVYKP